MFNLSDLYGSGGGVTEVHSATGTTDISTNSTSYVDMTDMSITISGAGTYLITFTASLNPITTDQYSYTAIVVGSTVKVEQKTYSYGPQTCAMQWVETLATGTHTFKVQWKRGNSSSVQQNPTTDGERVLTVIKTSGIGGSGGSSPTGAVSDFAGSSAPEGWLMCDGSAVSRTTYSELFTVISTTYGAGDGSTTFNVPDARDRFIWGAGGVAVVGSKGKSNQLNLSGSDDAVVLNYHTGFGYGGGSSGGWYSSYNQMPPYLALNKIIKT